jgi:GxxExxY protein
VSGTTSTDDQLLHGEITGKIINAFYAVYDELGYGFLESVYRRAMAIELRERGLEIDAEIPVEVHYKRNVVGVFRVDLVAGDLVVLELKASRAVDQSGRKQVINLLAATRFEVGLLFHFGPKPAFERIVYENSRKRPVRDRG